MVACHVFRIRGLVRLIHVMTEQELTRQIIALRDPMFRFARTLLLRRDEAEDAVADVVARLLRRPEQVRVMLSRARCRLREEVEKLMDHGTK